MRSSLDPVALPLGAEACLAGAVDLGTGARPEPGVPATAVPRRSPAFASLAPGGLARRPLHRDLLSCRPWILLWPERGPALLTGDESPSHVVQVLVVFVRCCR